VRKGHEGPHNLYQFSRPSRLWSRRLTPLRPCVFVGCWLLAVVENHSYKQLLPHHTHQQLQMQEGARRGLFLKDLVYPEREVV
jgi:hypothetical protein